MDTIQEDEELIILLKEVRSGTTYVMSERKASELFKPTGGIDTVERVYMFADVNSIAVHRHEVYHEYHFTLPE